MDRRLRAARVPLGCLAALAIGAALIGAVGKVGTLPDWLMGEAQSPGGVLVARAWCMDGCDITDSRTITVSSAQRNVAIRRDGDLVQGDMPESDEAARISIAEDGEVSLRWTGPRSLRVEAPCLSGRNGRPQPPVRTGEAEIGFVSAPVPRPCPNPGGP